MLNTYITLTLFSVLVTLWLWTLTEGQDRLSKWETLSILVLSLQFFIVMEVAI